MMSGAKRYFIFYILLVLDSICLALSHPQKLWFGILGMGIAVVAGQFIPYEDFKEKP